MNMVRRFTLSGLFLGGVSLLLGGSAFAAPSADNGKMLFQTKTCVACHSIDGSQLVGPSLKGIAGKKGKLADGSDYVADDAYLTKALKDPMSEVVEGFPPSMPPLGLTDPEVADLIAYMKTLT